MLADELREANDEARAELAAVIDAEVARAVGRTVLQVEGRLRGLVSGARLATSHYDTYPQVMTDEWVPDWVGSNRHADAAMERARSLFSDRLRSALESRGLKVVGGVLTVRRCGDGGVQEVDARVEVSWGAGS